MCRPFFLKESTMKFRADHHFVIGGDHVTYGKPCQDHALSQADDGMAAVVVSDGCSSGGETDMGARLTTFLLMQTIRELDKGNLGQESIFASRHAAFSAAATLLGLRETDTLATLLYAYLAPSGGHVYLQGDGVVARELRDGTVMLSRFDWANNMPFYPAYADSVNGNSERFVLAHGGDPSARLFTAEHWVRSPGSLWTKASEEASSLQDGMKGVSIAFDAAAMEETSAVAVFTDGVTSVSGVDWKDAVLRLLDFKTTEGAFMKRRLSRALKEFGKDGNGPRDDLACAVVLIAHDKKGGTDECIETTAETLA